MADIGFVIFDDIKLKSKKSAGKIKSLVLKLLETIIGFLFNAGFFKTQLGTSLYFSKRREDLQRGVAKFELMETIRNWVIKLPFSAGTFSHLNKKFIYEHLQNLCVEKGIKSCLLPSAIREDAIKNGFEFCPDSKSKLLLKSLLIPVIEDIYPKAGKRIEQLDMVVVSGSDNEELFTLVRLLEPYINFITVISPNKDVIENTFSELFAESGLSFTISTEYKNQLKNAELIINLCRPLDIAKFRIPKKALMINLNGSAESVMHGENPVINDIAVEIPGPEVKNLMFELHGYYSKAEVYDIIILNKLDLDKFTKYSLEAAESIRHDFMKAGLRIGGFVGRRGTIGIDSVIKAIV